MKGGNNMKKLLSLFVLATMLLTVGFASAQPVPTVHYDRPCAGVDLCTWKTVNGASLDLPLGSQDTASCNLDYNTYWAVNTNTVATCEFNGDNLADVMLYLSIDNDIVSCTLNGNEVLGFTAHENCAPADPRNGFTKSLTVINPGKNTLVCTVADRGVMSHFDACVTGTKTIPSVPEFGAFVGALTVLGALGTFFVVRRK